MLWLYTVVFGGNYHQKVLMLRGIWIWERGL